MDLKTFLGVISQTFTGEGAPHPRHSICTSVWGLRPLRSQGPRKNYVYVTDSVPTTFWTKVTALRTCLWLLEVCGFFKVDNVIIIDVWSCEDYRMSGLRFSVFNVDVNIFVFSMFMAVSCKFYWAFWSRWSFSATKASSFPWQPSGAKWSIYVDQLFKKSMLSKWNHSSHNVCTDSVEFRFWQ